MSKGTPCNCNQWIEHREQRAEYYQQIAPAKRTWLNVRFPWLAKVRAAYCRKCDSRVRSADQRYYQ